ncbi:MAG: histidine triad (HIT) family protein [Paraglaciecola sp.]|jgi:histidine triad (HIT) family protein
MASIFTKIINGEIPCHKIAESNKCFAFLDIRPQMKGHTLIIPKKETDYIFEVEDDILASMFPFAKKIAIAIKKVVPCERVGVVVAGLEVPHAHIHLVPMNEMKDLSWQKEVINMEHAELAKLAVAIRAHL